ncbi:alkene reductase [Hyphomicrobiales bacterium 4NK60-0047b]|jgi:N-ethylmaleimide reductase
MTDLFSPIQLGDYQLPNRIFMAPLTRARSLAGAVPKAGLKAEYYRERASAGLIIAEATAVSQMGLGWLNTPGIWNEAQQEAWSPVTKAVHEKNGRIFIQLWHMGAVVTPDFIEGRQPLSASNVQLEGELRTPKERKQTLVEPKAMTTTEINQVQNEFVDAAKHSIAAGFDGVELHAANGFLIDQFIRDKTNKRKDQYGGSIENRIRFCLEIVEKISKEIGSGKVGIRISPTNKVWGIKDSDYLKTFSHLVERLNEYDLAYLHILEPKPNSDHFIETVDYITPKLRELYQGTIIANGGFTKETATHSIQSNEADAIAFGGPFIANPDLVERFMKNAELNVPVDDSLFYTNEAQGYTKYPTLEKLRKTA